MTKLQEAGSRLVAGEHQLDAFLIQFSYISHTFLILINGFSPNWEPEAGSQKPEASWWLASISWIVWETFQKLHFFVRH